MSSSRYPEDARKRKDKDKEKEKEKEQERDGKVNKRSHVFHTKEGEGTPEEPTPGNASGHYDFAGHVYVVMDDDYPKYPVRLLHPSEFEWRRQPEEIASAILWDQKTKESSLYNMDDKYYQYFCGGEEQEEETEYHEEETSGYSRQYGSEHGPEGQASTFSAATAAAGDAPADPQDKKRRKRSKSKRRPKGKETERGE
ncbi:hypothetical protein MANI_025693 [Metarhizium anisopliae]|nr:hypothetical protein MANI_025693 [Metarhizium anisopliae]